MVEKTKEMLSYNSQMAGKDAEPKDTVARIKNILNENGIETEEQWGASDVPHCYSLRINIKGTSLGTNGKGVTKELALASGYGELMERLQLGLIWKNKLQTESGVSSCETQGRLIPASRIWEDNPQRYELFAKELEKATGEAVTGKELLLKFADEQGNVRATAFYNLTKDRIEYLPVPLCKRAYGSNGGAAGNTMEEAMVQAISEIVERKHQLRVIHEEIILPDISEEVLQSSAVAYEIITFLRNNGFRVSVKDCSLGTGFPVVCICLIDTNTGRYHTHFGAFPDFDISLQRTLTESFQGRKLQSVAKHEDFFFNSELHDYRYLAFELVYGTSEKSPGFFLSAPSQSDDVRASFGSTNQDRLKRCVNFFREKGYDILVRDSSALGFPTCQIIIPGYSEVLPHRLSEEYNDTRYSAYASKVLKNPTAATMDELVGLILHIQQSKKLSLTGLEKFTTEAGLPANIPAQEEKCLMGTSLAYASYALGRYKDVITYLDSAIRQTESPEYLLCVKRYLSMKINKYSPEDTAAILRQLHKKETVDLLMSCIEEKKNPLAPVVLQCDMRCSENCMLFGRCKKQYTEDIAKRIAEKAAQIDQTALQAQLNS